MRRLASIISLALVLVGLEMSTRMVSLTVARIGSGFSAITNGLDFHVSSVRFLAGFVLLVVGIGVAMTTSWVARVERKLHKRGDRCAKCRGETSRTKRKPIHRLLSRLMGQDLSHRRCEECGWTGLALKY